MCQILMISERKKMKEIEKSKKLRISDICGKPMLEQAQQLGLKGKEKGS